DPADAVQQHRDRGRHSGRSLLRRRRGDGPFRGRAAGAARAAASRAAAPGRCAPPRLPPARWAGRARMVSRARPLADVRRPLGTVRPSSATDIITSIMAAPALEHLCVPKLVAHMFVFYFGILADLTPPTAISTYATSSIAGADVWRTQWLAMLLALSGFVIPF